MEGENVEKHSSGPTPYAIKMEGPKPREGEMLTQGDTAPECGSGSPVSCPSGELRLLPKG